MAQKLINIGTGPNTGAADPVREAFKKVNENFTELYIALGLNSDTTLNLGAFEFNGSTMSTTDSSPIIIDQATTINSSLTVGGDVLPETANSGDLGSAVKPWKSLYVSNNTIYLGGTALGINNTGDLTLNGNIFSPDYSTIQNAPTDISDLTDTQGLLGGGTANTGDVTFNGVKIIGAGTASGDGAGYSTLELVPDNNLYGNHQYLVIDPTAPSHIHIRAGGTQDNSNADLFLGGEKNYVRVRDSSGIRLQNETLNENFYFYEDPTFTSGSWYEDNGNFYLEFTTTDQSMINWFWEFSNNPLNRIVVNQNDTLIYGNWALSVGNNVYKIQVTTGPVTSPWAVNTIEFQIFTTNTNYIHLENNDFRVDVFDDIRMFGRDIFRLANYSPDEPIEITTNYNATSKTWSFQPNGTITFPDGTTQSTAYAGATPETDTLDSVTDRGATTTNNITVGAVITTDITNKLSAAVGTQVTGIRPPDGAGANLGYVWVPDETQISSLGDITGWTMSNSDGLFSTTVAQMRYDLGAAWAIQTADPLIYTGTYTFTSPDYAPPAPLPVDINVSTNTWTFGTDGKLTIPTGGTLGAEGMGWTGLSNGVAGTPVSVVYKTSTGNLQSGITLSGGNDADGEGSIFIDTYSAVSETYRQWQFNADGGITLPYNNRITVGGAMDSNAINFILQDSLAPQVTHKFSFDASNGFPALEFPNGTFQTTAWTGGRVVEVPTHSYGASGDQSGDLAFSNGYIYYCTQNYVPNSSSVTALASTGTFVWVSSAGYAGDLVADFTSNSTGWSYNGISIVSVVVDNAYGPGYLIEGAAGFSVVNGDAYALISPITPDIWKRVAWSGDTW